MHPELITLPGGFSIKTYGFFLMLGFLSAVWLAMKRCERMKANPDRMLDLAFLALFFGVGGARAFYVIHYWKEQFAGAPNKLFAIIDITSGGLEFLGGFFGAFIATVVYCWWKQISLRLYADIIAPSVMWGLAFGRIGCYFNGCCFGAMAAHTADEPPAVSWAVQFPYGSPAQFRHWQDREVSVPAELIVTTKESPLPAPVPEAQLAKSVEARETARVQADQAAEALRIAKAEDPNSPGIPQLEKALAAARKRVQAQLGELAALTIAQQMPSRANPTRITSVSELQAIAANVTSAPVHPTQIYASAQAMLLALFLGALLNYRKRHGVVIGVLFLMYPVQRILLELIRADNPHDVAGLTVSQSLGVLMVPAAFVYLYLLYKRYPMQSPLVAAERAALKAAEANQT